MFSSPPPPQQKMVACEVKTVLTNLIVIIISQYIVYQIIMSYTLDLPNVICQLYLSELKKKMKERKKEERKRRREQKEERKDGRKETSHLVSTGPCYPYFTNKNIEA